MANFVLSPEFHQQVRDGGRRVLAEPQPVAGASGSPRLRADRRVGFLAEDLFQCTDPRGELASAPQLARLNLYTFGASGALVRQGEARSSSPGAFVQSTLVVANYYDHACRADTFLVVERQWGEWWPVAANCFPTVMEL